MGDAKFIEKNKGKFAIKHAGILVQRAFDTKEAAATWAEGNYRYASSWTVVQL